MRKRLPLAVAAAAFSLVLAGCGEDSSTTDAAADGGGSDAFPVTIEHAFGETTIEAKPERVASVAWANHEVPLALGIAPVGMSKATWGDDDKDGVLPWVEDALAELDAETPVLFDETEGVDFEAVADTQPDVILAAYSGLTQEEYDTLSKIAPVVAYPEVAWATDWRTMIELNSAALGMAEEGDALIEEIEGEIAAAVEARPELEGTTAMFTSVDPTDLSTIGFYTTLDPRAAFLTELGMELPTAVEEGSEGTDQFWLTRSAEEADAFDDLDVLITYGDAEGTIVGQLQGDKLMAQIPAVADGAVAVLTNDTPLAAASNPSPLGIRWGLEDYLDILAEAAETAQG
ncbi:iron-siderophore ABC transporter substrate-binding protein [Nocardioides massiliensis]|uniref:Iron complex transport system substrate-binding protein n=1 Tax=Nocardioides massiliensis TaxID=1325935 RepID=A0ABT9NIN0_9ACTN|nr:iron-siderophore ABC transporter substrate-binding protein [Nocardioides massiliensis]MDP9820279.1 iron complex transport system substrate-binding protein [Nocardioides massiliensis]